MLIKGVRVIDKDSDYTANVLIEEGKIKEITRCHGDGKFVLMPAFIDMHTHLRTPGYEYKEDLESGQRAALKGGYTTLCSMANTLPVCDNEKTIEYIKDESKRINLCEVIPVCSVTRNLEGKEIVNMDNMIKHTNLFSDDGNTIFSQSIMKDSLELSKEYGFKILTHCQPEAKIIKRDLSLLEEIGGNLHICHVSSKESVEYIKNHKDKGLDFTCEVAPHHIYGYDIDYKVNPSFRSKEDFKSLIEGIKDGYIDIIATDHAPHSEDDKKKGSPGISNIEVAFSMVYTSLKKYGIDLNKISELMSYNPAKILGLNKGLIRVGDDADLVLIDVDEEYEIDTNDFVSKGKNNPFNREKVKGRIIKTMRKGRVLYDYR
ncbi:MAG: dihydroorotase [Anaeromicrobium sp.]|jgi:dihydroorotase|uniref:dihydroorotase n=1 Tax=Anaeromicrobium sp. TaxID=1929132 RepID=UPI0025D9FFC1|nr:dihydroorotase [Anaeromicrobium sp.]MCT4595169.1 dihydroorotase [Anaeromicrobium sp.]